MARTVVDKRLQDRTARGRLEVSSDIYWRSVAEGCHIGYYKGSRAGKWVVRYRRPGGGKGYVKLRIGEADDIRDADGVTVLDWRQALAKAHEWFEQQARGDVAAGPLTVGDALDEYLKGFRGRDGKVPADVQSRVDKIIRPELGALEVATLTTRQIAAWHQKRAALPAKLRTGRFAETDNVRAAESAEDVRKRRATANRDLTVLKAALNRAADHRDDLPVAAWQKVKPFAKVDIAKRRYLTDDEARRLVNSVDRDFRSIVRAALLTGGRYGELRGAKVKDY
ncbi:MAG: hypothetical protein JOY99_14775, partial [Sphingomonadaceae bacterium]|nr:hypothetical protein [Sphingomonadaceae bacterium]